MRINSGQPNVSVDQDLNQKSIDQNSIAKSPKLDSSQASFYNSAGMTNQASLFSAVGMEQGMNTDSVGPTEGTLSVGPGEPPYNVGDIIPMQDTGHFYEVISQEFVPGNKFFDDRYFINIRRVMIGDNGAPEPWNGTFNVDDYPEGSPALEKFEKGREYPITIEGGMSFDAASGKLLFGEMSIINRRDIGNGEIRTSTLGMSMFNSPLDIVPNQVTNPASSIPSPESRFLDFMTHDLRFAEDLLELFDKSDTSNIEDEERGELGPNDWHETDEVPGDPGGNGGSSGGSGFGGGSFDGSIGAGNGVEGFGDFGDPLTAGTDGVPTTPPTPVPTTDPVNPLPPLPPTPIPIPPMPGPGPLPDPDPDPRDEPKET